MNIGDYFKAYRDVNKILHTYQDCHDILSKKLQYWGEEVRQVARELRNESDEIIQEIAEAKIEELSSILVNPIDNSPLRCPVIERSWTWEDWTRKEFQRYLPYSPLDDAPWEDTAYPHEFAKEMIGWVQSVKHFLKPSSALVAVEKKPVWLDEKRVACRGDEPDPVRAAIYYRLAKNAVRRELASAAEKMAKCEMVRHKEFMREEDRKERESREAAEKKASLEVEALRERFQHLQIAHDDKVEKLRDKKESELKAQDEKRALIDKGMIEVDQEAAIMPVIIKERIVATDRVFQERVDTFEKERVAAVHESMAKSDVLLEEMSGTASSAKEEIASLTASYEKKAGEIGVQIEKTTQEVGVLRADYKEKAAASLNGVIEIAKCKGGLRRTQEGIAVTHHMIDSVDDDGCCIM